VLDSLAKHEREAARVVIRVFQVGRAVHAGADFSAAEIKRIIGCIDPLDSSEHARELDITPVARETNVAGEIRQIKLGPDALQLDAILEHALIAARAGTFDSQ